MTRYHAAYLAACACMVIVTVLFFGVALPAVFDYAIGS